MRATIGLLLVGGILGSPVWISLAIGLIPRRWLVVAILLCGLQILIAYGLWWFFWGGGIGGEARLDPAWQWTALAAVLPILVTILKWGTR
ncbi:MAG: hypothetical protein WDZ31_00690 [Phycisphaeraceae bacterium]